MEMFSPPGTTNLVIVGFISFTWQYRFIPFFVCTMYTIVSRLGSCCKFGPLVSLLDNLMGVIFTRVRTIVYSPWIIGPLWGLNPWPTRGPSQTPRLLMFIGTVVPIQTCMGPRSDSSSQCVKILRHSADANPQSWTRIFGPQAVCIRMSLSPI